MPPSLQRLSCPNRACSQLTSHGGALIPVATRRTSRAMGLNTINKKGQSAPSISFSLLTHSQCDFAIHDAVDLGLSIEEAEERSRPFVCAVGAGCNKRYRQMNGLKVSCPLKSWSRQWVDSQYHYLNSGEHGQYGLRMLQNGTHPHPPSVPQPPKKTNTPFLAPPKAPTSNVTANNNTSIQRSAAAAPYAVPSKLANGMARPNPGGGPRMGTWPAKPLPPKQAPPVQLPSQKGRDAVLFAAFGNDPLDVNGRLEI